MPKIPQEIMNFYGVTDPDTLIFCTKYDEPIGSILVVGAHDEESANMLAVMGNDVTGIDLRKYDKDLKPCKYKFIQGDFCDFKPEKEYDTFVSISAIEHFGYDTYQEGNNHRFYDVIAMRKAWECLRIGGTCYITVPFSKNFIEYRPHWRVYSPSAVNYRLKQDFEVETMVLGIVGPLVINGQRRTAGDKITVNEAQEYDGTEPHITVFLKMRKFPVNRISPR